MPKDAAPEVMPELGLDALFGVKGKIGVVTGAGTGIGKSEFFSSSSRKMLRMFFVILLLTWTLLSLLQ